MERLYNFFMYKNVQQEEEIQRIPTQINILKLNFSSKFDAQIEEKQLNDF